MPHFAQQVVGETRLSQEHITPGALSSRPVFRPRTRGEHDDGRGPRTVFVAQARHELNAVRRVVEIHARNHDVGLDGQLDGAPRIRDGDHRKSVVTQILRIYFQAVVIGPLNKQDDSVRMRRGGV